MSLPCAAGASCLGGHSQVSDVTYTGQRLSSEAICANRPEIIEIFKLRCGEALCENGQIVFLNFVNLSLEVGQITNLNPVAVVCDLK